MFLANSYYPDRITVIQTWFSGGRGVFSRAYVVHVCRRARGIVPAAVENELAADGSW